MIKEFCRWNIGIKRKILFVMQKGFSLVKAGDFSGIYSTISIKVRRFPSQSNRCYQMYRFHELQRHEV